MATTTFTCNKDARIADNGSDLGAGTSDFNPIGPYSGYLYRTLLGFSYSFTGMVSITSAILHVRTSTQYYVGFGSDPDVSVRRVNASWSEGSSSGMSASNAVHWGNQPAATGSTATGDISPSESTWDTIDITTLMQEALAAGVFYGLRLFAASETNSADTTEIYSREQGSSDPYISVTYTTNVAPTTPTGLDPTGGEMMTGVTPTIQFTHVDADGDALLKYDLQVSTDSTFASATHLNIGGGTSGRSGNNVDYVYAGTALTRGTTYYWRARTYSTTGILTASPWCATQSFKCNRLPTVTLTQPSAADAVCQLYKTAGSGVNPRLYVSWTFSDPDGSAQATYRVVVVTDAGAAFHDSGTLSGTTNYYVVPVDVTRGAFYKVTVTVTDDRGEADASPQTRCKAQWAVVEYRRDLGATVTNWSANPTSASGTNKSVIVEYASSAAGAAIGTWYSSIGGAALGRWFHWRVWLFAWSGATTPSLSQMSLTYTNAAAVPPDGWVIGAQFALDTGSKVYGTQSLKVICNGTSLNGYQLVKVEPYTDYILSAKLKSDGNSGVRVALGTTSNGGTVADSSTLYNITATTDWTEVHTPVWNSGANSQIYIRLWANGAAGTNGWYDAIKLEASRVVTPWAPGFIGAALSVDAGGIQIDAKAGGIFRLQGSNGGARDTVELGAYGLVLGGDVVVDSPVANMIRASSGMWRARRAAGSETAFDTHEAASTTVRWRVRADGLQEWGATSSTADTNLYRNGANVLKTDDAFTVGGDLNVGANFIVGGYINLGADVFKVGSAVFPTTKATNDLYYRTDKGMWFFWDGARWLSAQMFREPFITTDAFMPLSATTGAIVTWGGGGSNGPDYYITSIDCVYLCSGGTGPNATNYWRADMSDGVGGTYGSPFTINSGANGSWVTRNRYVANLVFDSNLDMQLRFAWVKVGAPGTLRYNMHINYREIAV